MRYIGTPIRDVTAEIMELFAPIEGVNAVYFGKVRQGKTRNATADIIELLKRGEKVVANWKIEFNGYDERDDWRIRLVRFIFNKKYFYKFDSSNFHYIDPQDLIDNKAGSNIEYLGRLVGVHVYIDEGQWIVNSMEKYNPNDPEMVAKLRLILHGGHHCRSLNIITQRPENISKNVRSQINIWYRCCKRFDVFGFMIFQRWAIEDMKDDLPVCFDSDDKPLGVLKTYYVNKRNDAVFASYNTHAMRSSNAIVEPPAFAVYQTNRLQRFQLVFLPMWDWLVGRFIRPRASSKANTNESDVFGAVKTLKRSIRQVELKTDVSKEEVDDMHISRVIERMDSF